MELVGRIRYKILYILNCKSEIDFGRKYKEKNVLKIDTLIDPVREK